MVKTQRIQPCVPVGWIKYGTMPAGWKEPITAAHWADTIPSGWMRKWDKISGWMKDEAIPDGRKVSFTAVHKNDTFPSGWMRKCDKISGWMKYE